MGLEIYGGCQVSGEFERKCICTSKSEGLYVGKKNLIRWKIFV